VVGIVNGEDIVEVDCMRTLTKSLGILKRAEITYQHPLAIAVAPTFVSSSQKHRGI
jgi:hypothetical protein